MSETFATASELRAVTERITLLESDVVRLKEEVQRLFVRHYKTLLLQELRATYNCIS